jgi:Apea-like HEPN
MPDSSESELSDALVSLASDVVVDAYPGIAGACVDRRRAISRLHSRSRAMADFEAALLADPVFSPLFSSYLSTSTRRGLSIQSELFAPALLANAYERCLILSESPTATEIQEEVVAQLAEIGKAVAGEEIAVPAYVALSGLLLPEGCSSIDLGFGTLRAIDPRIRARFGEQAGSVATMLDVNGDVVAVDAGGDLLLAVRVPYSLTLDSSSAGYPQAGNPTSFDYAARAADSLKIGLLMSSSPTWIHELVLKDMWTVVFDPAAQGPLESRRALPGSPFRPRRLTKPEADELAVWSSRIMSLRVSNIEIALKRLCSAVNERNHVTDALTDAIIAWENLFGGIPKTTDRVCKSMACILGGTPDQIKARRRVVEGIYDLRSRVVHGDKGEVPTGDMPKINDALGFLISALKVLLTTRKELILPGMNAAKRSDLLVSEFDAL